MTDLKTLRPYFDRLVEDALDGAQERTRTTAPRLQASKEEGAHVIAVDVRRAPHGRTGRRWLAVAAAAMVFVAAAAVLVTRAGDKGVRTKVPAGDTPATTLPTPFSDQRSVTDPDSVFPVEGALASTPETGDLVAGVAFNRFMDVPDGWRDTSIVLYADGRLLRYPTPDVHGGIAEQRLTTEGVELVRSAFAPTGLLDPALTPIDTSACPCVIRVRDDSGRIVDTQPQPQPQPQPVDRGAPNEVDRLIEFITHLDTSLPASAWADREIKAYVPSRYEVSVWFEPSEAPENLDDGSHNVAVPDLSNVLAQVLPRTVVQDLDDHGWQHTPSGDSVVLTTAEARALAQAFTDAGHRAIVPGFYTWGMGITYHPEVRAPDPTSMNIRVEALLPDGRPLWAPG